MFSLSIQDLHRELRSFQTLGHCTQNVFLQVSGHGFLLEKSLPAVLDQAPLSWQELSQKDLEHHNTPGLTLNPLAGQNHNLFSESYILIACPHLHLRGNKEDNT